MNRLVEAEKLSNSEFRALYNNGETQTQARIIIYDLNSLNQEQRMMISREVDLANYLLSNH